MSEVIKINYHIKTQRDLNLSYIPFVIDGGIFYPTTESYNLGEPVLLELTLPNQDSSQTVEGKIVWITPKNALYYAYPGIGIQFIGSNAKIIREQIKAAFDNKMEIGGYTYGTGG